MGDAFASSVRASRRMAASLCVAAILRDVVPWRRGSSGRGRERSETRRDIACERWVSRTARSILRASKDPLRLAQADTNPQFRLLGQDVGEPRYTAFGSVQRIG